MQVKDTLNAEKERRKNSFEAILDVLWESSSLNPEKKHIWRVTFPSLRLNLPSFYDMVKNHKVEELKKLKNSKWWTEDYIRE